MDSPSRLRASIENSGLTLDDIAAKSGINLASLRDLMDFTEDWEGTLPVERLRALGSTLHVSPVWLVDGSSEMIEKHTADWLQERIVRYQDQNHCSLSSVEDSVGYYLKDADGKWIPVETFSLECLQSLSELLHIDWRSLI